MSVPGEATSHAPVPVATPVRAIERPRGRLPALRMAGTPATVVAGGIVGVFAMTALRVLRRRRRTRLGRRRAADRGILASRSFLVDVHVLSR